MTGARPPQPPNPSDRPAPPQPAPNVRWAPHLGDRRPTGSERARPTRAVKVPWIELYAVRIRWTTWIAITLIALRLIAPRPDGWRRWSDASQALGDVEAARTAALLYYQAASLHWPPPGRAGVAPAGLVPYMPGDASFSRARYKLNWEYAADTLSGARVIGVSVTGDDPRLAQVMAQRAPAGMPYIVSGRRFMVLIASVVGR